MKDKLFALCIMATVASAGQTLLPANANAAAPAPSCWLSADRFMNDWSPHPRNRCGLVNYGSGCIITDCITGAGTCPSSSQTDCSIPAGRYTMNPTLVINICFSAHENGLLQNCPGYNNDDITGEDIDIP